MKKALFIILITLFLLNFGYASNQSVNINGIDFKIPEKLYLKHSDKIEQNIRTEKQMITDITLKIYFRLDVLTIKLEIQ